MPIDLPPGPRGLPLGPDAHQRRELMALLLVSALAPFGVASAAPAPRCPKPDRKPDVDPKTGDYFYPPRSLMKHGDIVFPRRLDVEAIATLPDILRNILPPPEQLSSADMERRLRFLRAFLPGPKNRKSVTSAASGVDLQTLWPDLLCWLAEVRDDKMTLDQFLDELITALGGPSQLKDASEAIFAKQYVGHCGIIDLSDPCEPWVVESSHTHGGIRCIRYDEWEAERREHDAKVWLYRIDELKCDQAKREKFVNVAHRCRMQGIPYAIFDSKRDGSKFELDMCQVREVGEMPYLYCSELVYYCALTAFNLKLVDKDPACARPQMQFGMVTPKDLTEGGHLVKITGVGPLFVDCPEDM